MGQEYSKEEISFETVSIPSVPHPIRKYEGKGRLLAVVERSEPGRYPSIENLPANVPPPKDKHPFCVLSSYFGGPWAPYQKEPNNEERVVVNYAIPSFTSLIEKPVGKVEQIVIAFAGNYTTMNVPRPLDDKLHVVVMNDLTVAVLPFTGSVSVWDVEDKADAFIAELKKFPELNVIGTWRLARYDPPFLPPECIRNEILVDVEVLDLDFFADDSLSNALFPVVSP